jgi:hypothetical protein
VARHFDNWLKAYIAYTSDSESPDDFHFWTGVWTVAGALRRRVYINMRKFQWTPNFYIVLVAPPGIATKSTAARAGWRLLEKVPGVHFGPPSMTWQALTESLASAIEHLETIDQDGEVLFVPMSCLSILVSELGTFLKPQDGALMDVLTDLWDGQISAWGHKTRTTGQIDIKNPWLNIIGCTTPSWLRTNFPEHLIGGGLTSRCVFIYGNSKRKLVPFPDADIPEKVYYDLEKKLIEDLIEISALQGEYHMTKEAREWGGAWYEKHWKSDRPVHMASDRYEGYLARKQTHMMKLAIIIAASQSNMLEITRDHMEVAEQLLTSTEPHMMKVFESIGMVDEAQHVAEICAYVRNHKVLTSDELWSLVGQVMNQREFNEAVHAAVRGGALKVIHHPTLRMPNGEPKKALCPALP